MKAKASPLEIAFLNLASNLGETLEKLFGDDTRFTLILHKNNKKAMHISSAEPEEQIKTMRELADMMESGSFKYAWKEEEKNYEKTRE